MSIKAMWKSNSSERFAINPNKLNHEILDVSIKKFKSYLTNRSSQLTLLFLILVIVVVGLKIQKRMQEMMIQALVVNYIILNVQKKFTPKNTSLNVGSQLTTCWPNISSNHQKIYHQKICHPQCNRLHYYNLCIENTTMVNRNKFSGKKGCLPCQQFWSEG